MIDINSGISDGVNDGESGNDEYVEVESADDQDPGEHIEEVEEIEGDKTPELMMTSLRMQKFPMDSVKLKK